MDNPKELLLRSRSWAADDPPPLALDAEMQAFAAKSAEFNRRVRAELSSIPIPPHLRDRILAQPKVIRVHNWRKPRVWLAAAASLALLAGVSFYAIRPHEDQSIAGFRSRMVGFAIREYRMDVFTQDIGVLKSFLSAKGTPSDFRVPRPLAAKPLKGGASLTWQGKPVSMVCFDAGAGDTLYMFVLAGSQENLSQLATVKGLSTATWSADGKIFLLAGKLPPDELKALAPS